MSLVSVVIPTLNTRELTRACVDSVLSAGLLPGYEVEIVVVDDGSRDGTAEALEGRDPRLTLLRNPAPTGFSRAVNAGASRASGNLLVFLNSDTEVDRDALVALSSAFGSSPRLGIGGACLSYPDGRPQWSAGREPTPLWMLGQASGLPPLLRALGWFRKAKPLHPGADTEVGWVTGAALAVRREVWTVCGPFGTAFRFYGQDLDLCLRARDAGWSVRLLHAFRVVHHHGATIAESPGASGDRTDLSLLWEDLLLWARTRGGSPFEARCRRALRAGAAARILGRRLAEPFVPGSRRDVFRGETARVLRARRALAGTGGS